MKRLRYIFVVPFVLAVVSCGGDSVGSHNLSSDGGDSLTTQELPDMTVSISDSPDPVAAGAELTYSIFVRNLVRRSKASSVVLATSLPAGVKFVSSTPVDLSCGTAGGTVTCNLGDKSGGTAARVTIHVRVDPSTAGIITLMTTVTADEEEKNTVNNTASEETTVK